MQRQLTTPAVRGLDVALGGVRGTLAVTDHYRTTDTSLNHEGGDAGAHTGSTLVVRHTVNYLLASELASSVTRKGPLLDVGSGVGVFATWLARRLDRPLHLADHDSAVLQLAKRAFPDLTVHEDLADAPTAPVVTAMEVIEHIPYREQMTFVRDLISHVTPGGVLIVSTPDESGYVGGWSGYGPHVGTLDHTGFDTLLRHATGLPVNVWRIDGPGFRLHPLQRIGEPIANRAWTLAQRIAPAVAQRLTLTAGRWRRKQSNSFAPAPADSEFTVSADADGPGTGLLAAVFKPES